MKHFLTLLLASTLLVANEDINIEDDFLQSLEEVSEIATKSKLNIDDSPSFVTVLHSEKLQKIGIDNVFEALAQVPGVELKREKTGVPVVVFRGVSQKGEVKLMLNGVTINNTYRGSIYHYLDLPIELVDRIEVIRGAGSVLYGSGAISGVINIITKSAGSENKNSVFVSGGTYDYYKGGAILSSKIDDIHIALDAYFQNSEKEIDSIDRHLRDYSAGVKINNEHFALFARIKKSEQANAYGVFSLADLDRKKYDNTNDSLITQISYNNSLTQKSNIEILVGYSQYGQKIESQHPSFGGVNSTYSENSYFGQMDYKTLFIPNNELLLGVKYESAQVLESHFKWENNNPSLPQYNVTPDSSRKTVSTYLNDNYSISTDLDISAGLRYDNYSDFGDALSPTLGGVYRFYNRWRLKALYAKAFRAPSWVELTSNSSLKAETSESYEAGLIYKKSLTSIIRVNAYKTRINDLITKPAQIYIQTEYANFLGAEVEYSFVPNNQLELKLFASYVQAKDKDDKDLIDIANRLATASATYEFDFGVTLGGLLKYIGSSKRSDTDSRESKPTSMLLDGTLTYNLKDITASLIIKDIFDKGTYYALPTSVANNDFYDTGRTLLVKASWEF